MDKYNYILNTSGIIDFNKNGRYLKSDLELMTIFQLREICRNEKIIHGVINPMDKDDLIRVILRYRGADEHCLIKNYDEDGMIALNNVVKKVQKHILTDITPSCSAKIVVFKDLALGFFDKLTLNYNSKLVGTNALVVSNDNILCGVMNVEALGNDKNYLYLTKAADIPCHEDDFKKYSLYCFDKTNSDMIYNIYTGKQNYLPDHVSIYNVPLLDFEVREPVELNIPLAIDFGSSNTTAGVYLDDLYFENLGSYAENLNLKRNSINYTYFYDTNFNENVLMPSIVAIKSIENQKPEYYFGYEAKQIANSSYIDEGFCVFYDIKRWVSDHDKAEELTDRLGQRIFVKRKDIINAYLRYIISEAQNRFKCIIKNIHLSSPIKKQLFFKELFSELLSEFTLVQDMLNENSAVLYNTISDLISKNQIKDNVNYKALILDCGGETTDLCSCTFSVVNQRVSYKIDIENTYENGDIDFGGNNLTYRIMQILKIYLCKHFSFNDIKSPDDICSDMDIDIFRQIDENGIENIYHDLELEYSKAENIIPTRFKDYEKKNRSDYYKVKNNFYFLFDLAESVKKTLFNNVGIMKVIISSKQINNCNDKLLLIDKWKLTVLKAGKLEIIKEFPNIECNMYFINLLLKADIYTIIHKFLQSMYEKDELFKYSIIKMTGLSCKIDIFRDAIKEFVPGKIIKFKRLTGDLSNDYELKMACIDGALKYLRDKKYGYADIRIKNSKPVLPYIITAHTHTGKEIELINGFDKNNKIGNISRNMEDLTLQLYLKDLDNNIRYSFTYKCVLDDFETVTNEDVTLLFDNKIKQDNIDNIINHEVKFFIWTIPEYCCYKIVPILRNNESLMLGKEKTFNFENENWIKNFFDGTK